MNENNKVGRGRTKGSVSTAIITLKELNAYFKGDLNQKIVVGNKWQGSLNLGAKPIVAGSTPNPVTKSVAASIAVVTNPNVK